MAILVIGHGRGLVAVAGWRWLFLIPAIAMPVLVAISRMYRGEHHPTDILGSLLFSALWLTATTMLIRPNADGRTRARPHAPPTTDGECRESVGAARGSGSTAVRPVRRG